MHKVGRRKSSVANVQAVLGSGKILINKKSEFLYFQKQSLLLSIIHAPLQKIQAENKYDFNITVTGGGIFSQAYAI
uniref:ribosomal protein S9 n=1 Tax=Trentepohlia sp. BN17 TaxID=3063876 RepID=UPI001EDF7D4E|nr:ribosomal protein S9 [Trentepohlia sp. BN17]UIB38710.1 ribosomal protein S9 [Trentepohlia sp. BN17]